MMAGPQGEGTICLNLLPAGVLGEGAQEDTLEATGTRHRRAGGLYGRRIGPRSGFCVAMKTPLDPSRSLWNVLVQKFFSSLDMTRADERSPPSISSKSNPLDTPGPPQELPYSLSEGVANGRDRNANPVTDSQLPRCRFSKTDRRFACFDQNPIFE